jgi:hypothetical protein
MSSNLPKAATIATSVPGMAKRALTHQRTPPIKDVGECLITIVGTYEQAPPELADNKTGWAGGGEDSNREPKDYEYPGGF